MQTPYRNQRDYPAKGRLLIAKFVEGTCHLTRGKIYKAMSDVADNRVEVIDDAGEVNSYLASHFEFAKECDCSVCDLIKKANSAEELNDAMEKVHQWEKECVELYGFYIHHVGDDAFPGSDMHNIHTHGLPHSFDHMDLQIVFPLDPRVALGVIHSAVDLIKDGTKFEPEKDYSRVIHGFNVRAVLARETGRNVIRLIMPDKQGKLVLGEISEPFDQQYGNLAARPPRSVRSF